MSLHDDLLWQKLIAFAFDPEPVELSFTSRLARENNWSPRHAHLVVEEYRKFVHLAMRAGHPVTPSDAVDQAWHLHLTYTRSYWDGLCAEVLGKPLHHGPTQGGTQEDIKYRDWYAATLASYRRIFKSEPPADIWPHVDARFASADRFARIDTSAACVIPKAFMRRATSAGGLSAIGMVGLIACEGGRGGSGYFWGFLAFIALMVVWTLWIIRNSGGGGKGGGGWGASSCGSSGCSSSGCRSSDSDSGSSGCGSSGCGGGGCGGGD